MKEHRGLVTYVVPSFNHEKYIGAAIRSVIDQSYEDIELLIIDDGSTDNSVSLIESLVPLCEKRFVRFEFISQENMGLTNVLNKALNWAQGDFFCGIASDDINLKFKTELLVNYIVENSLDAVCGGYVEIDALGAKVRSFSPNMLRCEFDDILLRNCKLYSPSALFSTLALRSVGGYDRNLVAEDRDIWLSLSYNGFRIGTISDHVTLYRRHEGNLSSDPVKMIENRLAVYNKYHNYPNVDQIRARDLLGAAYQLVNVNPDLAYKYFKLALSFSCFAIFSKKGFLCFLKIFFKKFLK